MGKSIGPMLHGKAGSGLDGPLPALIGVDESPASYSLAGCSPAGPPPLHRPRSGCATVVLPVEPSTANGIHSLNRLCQKWGQVHIPTSVRVWVLHIHRTPEGQPSTPSTESVTSMMCLEQTAEHSNETTHSSQLSTCKLQTPLRLFTA